MSINGKSLLIIAYAISYLVFLRLSAWSGGFAALTDFDPISIGKVLIRLVTFLIAFAFFIKYFRSTKRVVELPVTSLMLFLLLAFFSIIYSSNSIYSSFRLFEHVGYLVFSMAIVIAYLRDEGELQKIVLGVNNLMMASALSLIIIVWLVMMSAPEYAFRHLYGDIYGLGGDILHVHTLANISALTLSVCLYRLSTGYKCNKPFYVAIVIFCLATVLMTRSRSGLLIVAFSFALILLIRYRMLFVACILPAVLLGGVVGLNAYWEPITEYGLRGQSIEDLLTLTERTNIWYEIVRGTFYESPIMGYGYQMLSHQGLEKHFIEQGYVVTNAHNTFIQVFAGLGLFGLMVFIFHLALVFYYFYWTIKRLKGAQRLAFMEVGIILICCLLASVTQHGVVGMTTPVVSFYMMSVVLVALSYISVTCRLYRRQESSGHQLYQVSLNDFK